MLSCFYNGKFFNNDQEGYTEVDKRLLGKERRLICPICGQAVYYNSKGKVVSHFSHYPGTACNEEQLRGYDSNNETHNNAKLLFAKWVKNQLPDAKVVKDRYFPEVRLIADVYFEWDELKVALEIQFKHITPETLLERRQSYKSIGVKDIWIFMREGTIIPGSPYERHYYKSNNRELYYMDIGSGMFTYFKGLKKEQFDTACVNLMHCITRSCKLENVTINTDGLLSLPGCRDNYARKLQELRSKRHEELKKKNEFRNGALKRLEDRQSYRANRYVDTETGEIIEKRQDRQKVNSSLKLAAQIHAKNKKGEFAYDEFRVVNDGTRKFLYIKFRGEINEVKYEIISSDGTGSFKYFICKGFASDYRTLEGKGYIIKIFGDRDILTIENWF